MFSTKTGKLLLAASAVAGLSVLAMPSPGKAASIASCDAYARDAAADSVPDRGLIGGLVALPFEVTGALLTGHTSDDFHWKQVYDHAYADCMADNRVAVISTEEPSTVVTVHPRAGTTAWLDYCSAKYRSFDPDTGTYTTYSGEQMPCR